MRKKRKPLFFIAAFSALFLIVLFSPEIVFSSCGSGPSSVCNDCGNEAKERCSQEPCSSVCGTGCDGCAGCTVASTSKYETCCAEPGCYGTVYQYDCFDCGRRYYYPSEPPSGQCWCGDCSAGTCAIRSESDCNANYGGCGCTNCDGDGGPSGSRVKGMVTNDAGGYFKRDNDDNCDIEWPNLKVSCSVGDTSKDAFWGCHPVTGNAYYQVGDFDRNATVTCTITGVESNYEVARYHYQNEASGADVYGDCSGDCPVTLTLDDGYDGQGTSAIWYHLVLVPPSAPSGLGESCTCDVAGSCTASLYWDEDTEVTRSPLRVDDGPPSWRCSEDPPSSDCCSSPNLGDICDNNPSIPCFAGVCSYTFTGSPDHTYDWWVHACNGPNWENCSAAAFGAQFLCKAFAPPPPPPTSTPTPTPILTPIPTSPPLFCNPECISRGYESGICREGMSEPICQFGETSIGETNDCQSAVWLMRECCCQPFTETPTPTPTPVPWGNIYGYVWEDIDEDEQYIEFGPGGSGSKPFFTFGSDCASCEETLASMVDGWMSDYCSSECQPGDLSIKINCSPETPSCLLIPPFVAFKCQQEVSYQNCETFYEDAISPSDFDVSLEPDSGTCTKYDLSLSAFYTYVCENVTIGSTTVTVTGPDNYKFSSPVSDTNSASRTIVVPGEVIPGEEGAVAAHFGMYEGPLTCSDVVLSPSSMPLTLGESPGSLVVSSVTMSDGSVWTNHFTQIDFSSGDTLIATVGSPILSPDYSTAVAPQRIGETTITATVTLDSGETCSCTDPEGSCATVTVNAPGAWFQTKDGDVHAQKSITSVIPGSCEASPGCDPNFSLPGEGGYPGVVSYGTSSGFGEGYPSNNENYHWLANSTSGLIYSFDYLYKFLGSPTENWDGKKNNPPEFPGSGETTILYTGTNVAHLPTGRFSSGGKLIILAKANVIIEGSILVDPGSFLAVISSEQININEAVSEVQGIYIATNGHISIGTSGEGDIKFTGEGMFISKGKPKLKRDFDSVLNSTKPAMEFIYRPDFWINAPRESWVTSFTYQELAP